MEEFIEKLARECAEPLVGISPTRNDHFSVGIVGTNDLGAGWSEAGATEAAARVRALLAQAVADALCRFAATAPVPSPVGEARLAEIAERDANGMPSGVSVETRLANASGDRHDLLAHVAHVTRALHDCGQDGSAAVYSAGYEAGRAAGAKEQRDADVGLLMELRQSYTAGSQFPLAGAHHQMVNTSLVTDVEGDDK